MRLDRPLPRETRARYDEVRYRESLQKLGVSAPVTPEAIRQAHRQRASRLHPDRFVGDDEARVRATARIQEINAARDYALRHFRGFDVIQQRMTRARRNGRRDLQIGGWREWGFLPVTALYAFATLAVAAPVFLARKALPAERRARYRARLGLVVAWRLWLALAPHGALLAACFAVPAPGFRAWLGAAFLVMLSADVATLVTGDANALRRTRAFARARTLAENLAGAA